MKTFILILLLFSCSARGQDDGNSYQQQLEDMAEDDEGAADDEYLLQRLEELRKEPVNLNARELTVDDLPMLTTLQLQNLLSYRNLLGNLISVYELQAVPGFTTNVIQAILPYVTIGAEKQVQGKGEHQFLVRPGFPSRIYFRYKYQKKNLFQYGLLGERDAGETSMIDFYSFHLFARNKGIFKAIAIGDYTVNLGQGLIHWQSQAFRKSSSVLNIKRQADVLRPYHSAGEYNFQRGAAATLQRNNYEASFFLSYRMLTANLAEDAEYGQVITSINTSGIHRTAAEIEKKNNVALFTSGASLRFKKPLHHLALNMVRYRYSLPLRRRDEMYNLYSIRGNTWFNCSMDYSYTFRNVHFFGEWAAGKNNGMAMVNGMMASLGHALDLTLVQRAIGKEYHTVYGNAFTENTLPSNENGVYLGVSFKPAHEWKVDFYGDVFRFPWLKYRVDAPSSGCQYLFQITWKPGKLVEVYSRFRLKSKPLNVSAAVMQYPEHYVQENWRTHVSLQVIKSLAVRARIENCWYWPADRQNAATASNNAEAGVLYYADVIYKPLGWWGSANLRFMFFETAGFNTRLYAYENDVLFASSIPFFSGAGTRIVANFRTKTGLNCVPSIKIDLNLRFSTTIYKSMNSEAPDLKFQVFLSPAGKKTSRK